MASESKLIEQEALDRLRLLIDSAPRCSCGGNCDLLKSLAAKALDIQVHEIGFDLDCPNCNEPLFFDQESVLSLYCCKKCEKWYRYDPGTTPIEIIASPEVDIIDPQRTLDDINCGTK